MLRIGIDTGGTFTDFVAFEPSSGRVSIVKVPSTPMQPSDAPIAAIRQSGIARDGRAIVLLATARALKIMQATAVKRADTESR